MASVPQVSDGGMSNCPITYSTGSGSYDESDKIADFDEKLGPTHAWRGISIVYVKCRGQPI